MVRSSQYRSRINFGRKFQIRLFSCDFSIVDRKALFGIQNNHHGFAVRTLEGSNSSSRKDFGRHMRAPSTCLGHTGVNNTYCNPEHGIQSLKCCAQHSSGSRDRWYPEPHSTARGPLMPSRHGPPPTGRRVAAAFFGSASGMVTIGFSSPGSSVAPLNFPTASRATMRPVSTEPANPIRETSLRCTRAEPVVPTPVPIFTTPGGKSSSHNSPSRRLDRGAFLGQFTDERTPRNNQHRIFHGAI